MILVYTKELREGATELLLSAKVLAAVRQHLCTCLEENCAFEPATHADRKLLVANMLQGNERRKAMVKMPTKIELGLLIS